MYDFRDVGFNNIVSEIHRLAVSYDIDIDGCTYSVETFNTMKQMIKSDYISCWYSGVLNNNSSLRSYKLFKTNFTFEPYLVHVKNDRHRQALSKFRCSSHFLEIERARHQNVIPPIWGRTCPFCPYAVDDELHLLLFCSKNLDIRF